MDKSHSNVKVTVGNNNNNNSNNNVSAVTFSKGDVKLLDRRY